MLNPNKIVLKLPQFTMYLKIYLILIINNGLNNIFLRYQLKRKIHYVDFIIINKPYQMLPKVNRHMLYF